MSPAATVAILVGAVAGIVVAIMQTRSARTGGQAPGAPSSVARRHPSGVEPPRAVIVWAVRPFPEQVHAVRELFGEPTAAPRFTRHSLPTLVMEPHVLTFRGPSGTFLTVPTRAVSSVEVGRFPARPGWCFPRRIMGLALTLSRQGSQVRLTLFPLAPTGRALALVEAEELADRMRPRADPAPAPDADPAPTE